MPLPPFMPGPAFFPTCPPFWHTGPATPTAAAVARPPSNRFLARECTSLHNTSHPAPDDSPSHVCSVCDFRCDETLDLTCLSCLCGCAASLRLLASRPTSPRTRMLHAPVGERGGAKLRAILPGGATTRVSPPPALGQWTARWTTPTFGTPNSSPGPWTDHPCPPSTLGGALSHLGLPGQIRRSRAEVWLLS